MSLNYKSFGQGFPVIILHGLFGMLDNWQTIAKKLADNHTVYILDQRNHGRSPHFPEINYQLMADDLQQFMEDNWIYEAYVIGHSMGGKTAMQFALNYPERVKKLMVVDIVPKVYEAGHQTIFEALQSLDLTTVQSRKEANEHLQKYLPDDVGTQLFLLKNLTRKKEGGFEWKMNLPAIHQHYPRLMENVEGSVFEGITLFVRGALSDYVLDSDVAIIQQYFPNARIATVPDAGHWVHAAAPEAFLTLTQHFLTQ